MPEGYKRGLGPGICVSFPCCVSFYLLCLSLSFSFSQCPSQLVPYPILLPSLKKSILFLPFSFLPILLFSISTPFFFSCFIKKVNTYQNTFSNTFGIHLVQIHFEAFYFTSQLRNLSHFRLLFTFRLYLFFSEEDSVFLYFSAPSDQKNFGKIIDDLQLGDGVAVRSFWFLWPFHFGKNEKLSGFYFFFVPFRYEKEFVGFFAMSVGFVT